MLKSGALASMHSQADMQIKYTSYRPRDRTLRNIIQIENRYCIHTNSK